MNMNGLSRSLPIELTLPQKTAAVENKGTNGIPESPVLEYGLPEYAQYLLPRRRLSNCGDSHVLVIVTGGTIAMKNKNGIYVPESNYISEVIRRSPILHDQQFATKISPELSRCSLDYANSFVLPKLHVKEKRVMYHLMEYDVLLDSANMTLEDYHKIALDVKSNYEYFDGFVILHGTDTMAYTASYLSFMFQNLGKTVVLTGAQVPLCATRSDGVDNLLASLLIAGNYTIPEVTLFFHHRLFRGNRCEKTDNESFRAFDSPNCDPIVVMGVEVKVNWDLVWRSPVPKAFSIHTEMEEHVVLLRLFPGITTATIRAFLSPPVAGVVLQTYGAGNGPSNRQDILKLLSDASKRGVLIVNCTQCTRGSVVPSYETGKAMEDAGIVSGYDMTTEAALAKLSYLLGRTDLSYKERMTLLQENMRGELTKAEPVTEFRKKNAFFEAVSSAMKLCSKSEKDNLRRTLYPPMLCFAALNDDHESLEKLREQGADLCATDYDNRTPLHIAASEGSEKAVRYLLSKGASVYAKDRFESTPLEDAIRFKRFKVIEMLREAGAHLSIDPVRLGGTLCALASKKDVDGLRAWFDGGADMSAGDYNSRTPLHIAVKLGSLKTVKLLLGCGADLNAVDKYGKGVMDECTEEFAALLSDIRRKEAVN